MKLFYAPGACSLGIHILLEESRAPFELQAVNLREREQYGPAYASVNPKSKIPSLQRDDGTVLTEYGAIAAYIARCHPGAALIPNDAEGEARSWELLEYCVGTIHMQGYARMGRPGNFSPNEADHEAVRTRGREIFNNGLAIIDASLAGHDNHSASITIGDSALFYVCHWALRSALELPPHVALRFDQLKVRPSVQRALLAEGIKL